jgi:hypothetical protein
VYILTDHSDGFILVSFRDSSEIAGRGHDGNVSVKTEIAARISADGHTGCCWWVKPEQITKIVSAPVARKTIRRKSANQNMKLLALFGTGGTTTRLKAMFDLRIQNITARIAELREMGWSVHTKMKIDGQGNDYAEYSLPVSEQRRFNRTYTVA